MKKTDWIVRTTVEAIVSATNEGEAERAVRRAIESLDNDKRQVGECFCEAEPYEEQCNGY